MFNNWLLSGIAARGRNEFTKNSKICQRHFHEDEIIREDVFQMANDSTVTVPRKVPLLKENAVPSIFPPEKINFYHINPIYEEKRREQQNEETSVAVSLQSVVNCSTFVSDKSMSHNYVTHNEQSSSSNERNKDLLTWTELITGLNNFTFPPSYWSPIIKEESIMWTCWSEDLSHCIRRVVLEKNMTFRIFIRDKEIDFPGGKMEHVNIDNIQNLLQEVSNMHPCKEVISETCAKDCLGYVLTDVRARGVQRARYLPCAKHYKNCVGRVRPISMRKLSEQKESYVCDIKTEKY
ncbi:PREDICTED: uncharacterized protein LOC105462528 isoform X2 [Wasmannia auropunctata]|nr:PREDICTED: uncharacterized protein LOC105462528 isoform X2 [Wasmannia auropunctata]